MTIRRLPGQGTIETLPSGRKRARATLADGERHGVGTYDSDEEAEGMLAAFVERAAQENLAPVGGLTTRALAHAYADDLERSRTYVAMSNVRSIIRKHIETAPFADWPARRVTLFTLRNWVKALELSPASRGQVVVQTRKVFAYGVESKRLDANPAAGLKVPRSAVDVHEPWTYLEPGEQNRLLTCDAIPRSWRLRIAFAMGTGLRSGEQWALRLADLQLGSSPEVIVRYGSRKRAPKGRKIRRVPLFGIALQAAEEWLEMLPRWTLRNPDGIVFPGRYGGFQKVSALPDWKEWLDAADIERRVRWHDLRHTCGASLVSGWWGRAWSLEEVKALLGHHSIKETERYAHLGPTALKAAAAGTPGPRPRSAHEHDEAQEIAHESDLPRHPPKSPRKGPEQENNLGRVGSAWADAESVAVALIRAARAGEECGALVAELGARVLGSPFVALDFQTTNTDGRSWWRPVRAGKAFVEGWPYRLRRGADTSELADFLERRRRR